jgi:hypothetical protein
MAATGHSCSSPLKLLEKGGVCLQYTVHIVTIYGIDAIANEIDVVLKFSDLVMKIQDFI